MTDRRPHWDDDLVEAVRSKIGIHQHGPIGEIRIYNPFDDEVYNVIAEVEDWLGPVEEMVNDGERVQRVREIHQPHRCRMSTRHIDCSIMFGGECSHEGKCQVCREKYPCATICALGGDGEPPQRPLQFYKGRSEGFTAIQTVGDAPGCPACDGVAGTECRCHLRTGCDLGTTRCHRAEAAEAVIERVRELHHLTVDTVDCREGGVEDIDHCAECGYIYVDAEPCPTIRAIEGEL